MLSYLHSNFTIIGHDQSNEHVKKNGSKYIYRDHLDKHVTSPNKLRRRAHYKTAEAKIPLLQREDNQEEKIVREIKVVNDEKIRIRVTVRMTKKEALQLLSKCKKGGVLEFGDVTHELGKISANRIGVVDPSTIMGNRVLPSIAEEA